MEPSPSIPPAPHTSVAPARSSPRSTPSPRPRRDTVNSLASTTSSFASYPDSLLDPNSLGPGGGSPGEMGMLIGSSRSHGRGGTGDGQGTSYSTPPSSFGSPSIPQSAVGKGKAREVMRGLPGEEGSRRVDAGVGEGSQASWSLLQTRVDASGLSGSSGGAARTRNPPSDALGTTSPPLLTATTSLSHLSSMTRTSTYSTPQSSRSASLTHSPPRFSRSLTCLVRTTPSFLSRSRPSSSSSTSPSATPALVQELTGWKGKSRAQLSKFLRRTSTPTSLDSSSASSSFPFSSTSPSSAPSSRETSSRSRSLSAPLLRLPPSPLPCTTTSPFTTALSSPLPSRPSSPTIEKFPHVELDLFDFLLPREIRIKILGMLVEIAVEEQEARERDGSWRGAEAQMRWRGEVEGIRSLVRVGRVSKSWLSLSLDGQLWSRIPVSLVSADVVSPAALLRLVSSAGTFVRSLDLRGMVALNGGMLEQVVDLSMGVGGVTAFTYIDLRGCSSLDASSLTYLLSSAPALTSVNLSALAAVQGIHLWTLRSTHAPLTVVDISRCPNLDPSALLALPSSLICLRAAAIPSLSNLILISLGRNYPNLEVLDLSWSPALSDSAFQSLVTVDASHEGPKIELRASQVGSSANGGGENFKRLLPWRHLALTGCKGLTDRALQHVAHAVPDLELLELAQVGRRLHSNGLVKLLETTPKVRKLDLEDAISLTDEVLAALSPPSARPTTGAALEHLIISSCPALTDPAILTLIERCPALQTLESDGTTITDTTAHAFVNAVRARGTPGASLSILDDRSIGRRLRRELGTQTRPRRGQRGFWTIPFGYHDEPAGGRGLRECEEERVVVRSFYSALAVDAADRNREGEGKGRGEGGRRGEEREKRRACVVS